MDGIDSSLKTGMPCRITVNEGFVSGGQVLGKIRRSNLSFLQVAAAQEEQDADRKVGSFPGGD